MKMFDGIAAAADAARHFIITEGSALPQHVRVRLQSLAGTGSSPVDLVVGFTEAVFANRADVPEEAREIAAGGAVLAESLGFHGLNENSRGSKVAQVLNGGSDKNAPVAKSEYLAPDGAAEA